MAQTTSDRTAAKLAALIKNHYAEGPAALHGRIIDVFRVVDQPAPRGEQPEPEVGQTWRNRKSGRLVRITEVTDNNRIAHWECIDGSRGQKTGSVWLPYWTNRFDYEETA